MPDPRSVMKEYRALAEKRVASGLTAEEQSRFDQLRDLVGAEAPPPRAGFDVNAAAAQLRESLLPAGLRNRPPPTPQPPPVAVEPEPEPEPAQDAIESVFAQAPFSPMEAPRPEDALFDPATLGDAGADAGAPYDPNAPFDPNAPYDPNVAPFDPNAPYDPNAAAAWDPNAPYDPNAAPAYDAGAPYDPNAAPYDPNAPYDPSAAPYDPNAPYDPSAAAAWDPNAPYDPNAAPAYDAGAPYDPNAAPFDPNAPYDPNAAAAWDPNAPYDPNAAPAYDAGAPYDPDAAVATEAGATAAPEGEPWRADVDAPAWDPNAAPEASAAAEVPLDAGAAPAWETVHAWDASAAPAPAAFDAAELQADAGALPPAGWDAEQPPAEPPPAGVQLGEYDEAGGPAIGVAALAVEEDAGLASSLPFDAAAASEVTAGALPEGYETQPAMGEYDDTAGLTAPVPPEAAAEELGFTPAAPTQEPSPLGDLSGWQPEAALDEGFQLASGGSFGAGADAAAPEWAQQPGTPPWENAPPLDLSEAPVAEDAAYYEVEPALEAEAFAGAPPETLAAEPTGTAPELDFSQPDFSAEEPGAEDTGPGLSMAELLAAPAPVEPPEPEPGAELEALPPEVELAPALEAPPLDLTPEGEAAAEAAPFGEPEPGLAEPPFGEPAPELAEAAVEFPAPPAELAAAALPEDQPLDAFAAEPADLAFDPSVDFAQEPPAAAVAEGTAALVEDDEIPTLDEADIIEEITDLGEGDAAPPPQSLDFGAEEQVALDAAPEEPVSLEAAPEEPVDLAVDAAPLFEPGPEPAVEPVEAPTSFAPPPPAPIAPPPPVVFAPPPAVLAPPPPAAGAVPPRATPAPFPALAAVPPRATPRPFPAATAQPVPPAPEPAPPPASPPVSEPRCHVDGSHRVVVHTVEGQVKRGVLVDADLDGAALDLVSQPSGASEAVAADKVKAIFFMLSPGESPPAPEGKKVRVTFRDGRQVAGFSPDYDETGVGFFMIPGDTRTNTGRIWVYRAAVRQVTVS